MITYPIYNYSPIPEKLDGQFKKHIIGSQANLWTEYILTPGQVEYMLFPRLCAVAENLWTNENQKDYEGFIQRMDEEYKRLDLYHVNYRINAPEGIENINKSLEDSVLVTLENRIPSSEIRYTLDGTEPTSKSELYKKPFMLGVSKKQTLKAITIMASGKKSNIMEGTFEQMKFAGPVQKKGLNKGIHYVYYEDTVLSALTIDAIETKSGVVPNFNIPRGIRPNFFGMSYTGFIKVPEDNVYTFYLQSDDGSVLYINNGLIVNNNGFHWAEEKSGKVALKKGLHAIKVNYFQAKYGYFFQVNMESNKLKKQTIPDYMLFY